MTKKRNIFFITTFLWFSCALFSAAEKSAPPPAPKAQPTALVKPAAKPAPKDTNAPQAEAVSIATKIQSRYEQTRLATFSFAQTLKHPFMPTAEKSLGKVTYKAGNMLWQYQSPKKKEFYIRGKIFTYYSADDKVAYVNNCFEKDTLSASITFLGGQGKILDSFNVEPFTDAQRNQSLLWVKLIPKEKNAPLKSVALGANKTTFEVVETKVFDLAGGINEFNFSNFSYVPIDDATFLFTAPKDVLVQPMPNISCPAPSPAPAKNAPKKVSPPAKKTP